MARPVMRFARSRFPDDPEAFPGPGSKLDASYRVDTGPLAVSGKVDVEVLDLEAKGRSTDEVIRHSWDRGRREDRRRED